MRDFEVVSGIGEANASVKYISDTIVVSVIFKTTTIKKYYC